MAHKDLRGFIDVLEKEGQLIRMADPVLPEPDISAILTANNKGIGDQAPAIMFENIKGFTSDKKIASNVHGSWPNIALAFGMDKDSLLKDIAREFNRRYQNFNEGSIEEMDSAPWQECVIEGDDINVFELMPLFRLNPGDGGFFINKSSVVSRHPDHMDDFDQQNVGMYRIQVQGPKHLSMQMVPDHDIAVHFKAAEERNEPLPIYITIGNEPILPLIASMPLLYNQDEYTMCSAMADGAPYPVVTMPNKLQVPWGSEIVIEANVLPRVRMPDGPYGEFTGHLSGCRLMCSVEITRIYHRKNPLYEYCAIGMPWTEIDYMFINTGAALYVQLKESFPEVVDVNALYTHGLVVIVSTEMRVGGFAKTVGMSVLQTPHGTGYAKVVIIVDADVDPFNLPQVMWALSTKFNPRFDCMIVPNHSVLALDPGSDPVGITDKIILDAATPVPPDDHGDYSMQINNPPEAADWVSTVAELFKNAKSR